MKIELDDGSRQIGPAELEISDVPTARGTVSICVDEWPGCEGMSAAVEIDREAATKICEHLIRVFGLPLHALPPAPKPAVRHADCKTTGCIFRIPCTGDACLRLKKNAPKYGAPR